MPLPGPLEFLDIKALRTQDKKPRFCPSCGLRKVKAHALHYVCGVCLFRYQVVPLEDIESVRSVDSDSRKTVSFQTVVNHTVPIGRPGIRELLGRDPELDNYLNDDELGDRMEGI